ncbi:HAD family hydrolase [Embleya scabrispora]|uniref:HAD family hydrolase n=1 Tax=Embleya scabrispora TaxID=159449 RepID=A0A1T3P850_9ACTN|nr:HAD-IIA family hydrolase [Embleya scabrispora]OPC85244.1 HAD family hydrolase [Embleya scabrispora]
MARAYDVALLDLDGVVYTGARAVPHAVEVLAEARERGMGLAFVTNNASRTPKAVAEHLVELGVPAQPEDVVTSAQAAARVVAERVPAGASVLVVGGEGLEVALRERGLRPVRSADSDSGSDAGSGSDSGSDSGSGSGSGGDGPAAVVQGFAADVGWAELAEASYAVARGVFWVASNADLTIPTERGIAPGNGALVGVVRAATGVEPVVAGKPELPLHRETILRTGARRPLVVGDRLDTDIEGAHNGGVDSLLVLTGVTTPGALLAAGAGRRPTFVAEDLRALLEPAVTARRDGDAWVCGGWSARVVDGALAVTGKGARIDGLRAACAAVWAEDAEAADGVDTDGVDTDGVVERLGW